MPPSITASQSTSLPANAGFDTGNTPPPSTTPNYNSYTPPSPTATPGVSAPSPISVSGLNSDQTPQNFQVPNSTPVLGAPQVAPLQPTLSESAAQNVDTQLQGLNEELSGKSAFEIQQAQNLGYGATTDANGNIVVNDPEITSLNSQITALQNQAQAIPLQIQQDYQGRGATQNGVDSIQTAQLRDNAIQTLQLSSLVSAKQGQLSMAQQLVNQAVTQKYGPLQDQITALQNNLQLIQSSPEYSLEEQNRAQQQQLALNTQAAQLDLEKQNYLNAQTEALKYAPVASAQQLQAMQKATNPAQVAAIAASLGIQEPVAGRYSTKVSTITNAFGQQEPVIITTDSLTGQQIGSPQSYTGSQPAGSTIGTSSTPPLQPGSTTNGGNQPASPSIQNAGGASTGQGSNPTPSTASPSGYSTIVGSGKSQLPLAQYGLLANTDLDPSNSIDQMALTYINSYLKNGTVPSYTALGRGITPAGMGQVTARANQLYQEATGNALSGVNPELIGGTNGYQAQLNKNTTLLNQLNVQTGTIAKNFGLNLANMTANNVNEAPPIINGLADDLAQSLGYASTAQYLAQNQTIQNELGSLLAIKNAGGTTVADKISAGDLLPSDLSVAQQKQVLTTLMQEATNQQNSINQANAPIYKQIDPLMQDPNNPNRVQMMNSQFVEKTLESQGINYQQLMTEMSTQAPAGTQPAIDAKTGATGFATPEEIAAGTAIPL